MRARRATALLIALLGLAGLLVPAGAGAASSPDYIGVNLQPLMKDGSIPESRWGQYLQPLQDGQMTVSRIDVNWAFAEPTAPVGGAHTYNWDNHSGGVRTSIDYLMLAAAVHGIRAVPTFTAPPSWAWGQGVRLPDSQFGNFAAFIAAFATRYGPGGAFWAAHPELASVPTQSYEIWNEANSTNSWTGGPDPAAYARLLQVVYPVVKAAQPGGLVLASIGWQDFNTYLSGVNASGGGGSYDGIGFHPYTPHAIESIALIGRLRGFLAAIGRPTMPILVTETGQPATYTGPGAAHAYDGLVSDAARAGTESFAADAIGRSDCGVESWLVYAVTGSETSREIINEGYMGIERYADGSPNATGAALQAAQRRWVAFLAANGFSRGHLALCSGGATPDAALLPLDLTVKPSGRSCVAGTVDYEGNPLEAATLTLTRPDGKAQALGVDAFGNSTVCIPDGPPVQTVTIQATVPKAARSATYECAVPIGDCQVVQPAPGRPAAACTWTVKLTAQTPRRVRGSSRSRTKLKARAVCGSVKPGTKVKFVVGLKPKGRKHERRVRTVTLKANAKSLTFTAKAKVKKGDQLTLLHRADQKTGLPRIKKLVKLKAPRR